jgi:hypothetical protein
MPLAHGRSHQFDHMPPVALHRSGPDRYAWRRAPRAIARKHLHLVIMVLGRSFRGRTAAVLSAGDRRLGDARADMAPARADMAAGNYMKSDPFSSLAYQEPGQSRLKPVRHREPPAPPRRWPPQLPGRSGAGLRRCHSGIGPDPGDVAGPRFEGALDPYGGRPNATRPPNGPQTASLAVAEPRENQCSRDRSNTRGRDPRDT